MFKCCCSFVIFRIWVYFAIFVTNFGMQLLPFGMDSNILWVQELK